MKDKPHISARYPDLLPEQNDPALLDLVQNLETLYTSHELPARLTRPGEPMLNAASTPSNEPAYDEQPVAAQPGVLASLPPTRRSRWARLNTLAAVLFTTILVSALVGTFYLVHRDGGTSKISQKLVTCSISSNPKISINEIHMMTATEGWARSGTPYTRTWMGAIYARNQLLHTDDGGCHWNVVTPANHGDFLGNGIAYISGTAAWVMTSGSTSHTSFFARTTNSGQTWQFAPASISGYADQLSAANMQTTFLTPDLGWSLITLYEGTDVVFGKFIERTIDGGLSWQEMSHIGSSTAPGSLPWNAYYTGLSFLNASTGWAAGSSDHDTWLYVTQDGGQTWYKQILPGCGGTSTEAGTVSHPPQFFSARDGLITLSYWSPPGICVYVTHDGGTTWQATTFRPVEVNPKSGVDRAEPAPMPSFTDRNFGWFWQGFFYQPPNRLVTTHDGGQHWTQASFPFPLTSKDVQVNFISPNVGWLLSVMPDSTPSSLFQTLDGGKTWTQIHYSET